ncbi:MAG: thioredoxin family protein [Elusimicrobiota bacterium]
MLPLLALAVWAAEAPLILPHPDSALLNEILELKPAAGHHFNAEAPQKCGGWRADEVLARRFRCRLRTEGNVAVLVSVCDDAKTFCRQESFTVSVRKTSKAAAKSSPLKAAPKGGRRAPAGFIDNEPARARALARREGRLLLIDFYGIWCPPCNELEEHSYPDPAFQKASAEFVKIGLDADAETSFDWKARFKVGGYPTLIVADAELRELGRVVGARSGPALAAFLDSVKAYKDEPVEEAERLIAKGGDAATDLRRLRVAHWRAERGEFDETFKLLKGMTQPAAKRELLLARREKARREDDAAAGLAATQELALSFPKAPEFAEWAAALAEEDKPAAQALREQVRRSVAEWSASPALGESGYSAADLLSYEASFFEALGSTEDARGLYSQAADAYAAQAAKSPLKVPRSANLGRADALKSSGRLSEAESLYDLLVKAYPEEFTFCYDYASVLKDLGRAEAAYPYAVRAAAAGYGDNWLRAVRLKAELELKLGRAAEAAKTVDEALAQTELPKSSAVRTGRYLLTLRRLRGNISAAQRP